MADIILHGFVSAKSDSPDDTLIRASSWNDGHIFSGGINGQHLVYDNTQVNNMRWVDGEFTGDNTYTIPGTTASPINDIADIDFTTNSPVKYTHVIILDQVTTTGGVLITVSFNREGNPIAQYGVNSGAKAQALVLIGAFSAAGSHSVSVSLSATNTFTGGIVRSMIRTNGV
jgi:hypothetical protein